MRERERGGGGTERERDREQTETETERRRKKKDRQTDRKRDGERLREQESEKKNTTKQLLPFFFRAALRPRKNTTQSCIHTYPPCCPYIKHPVLTQRGGTFELD